jgi:hypothetical protein
MGGDLKDNSDDVDQATDDDCGTTTNEVGEVSSNECTKESAGGQDGDDERLVWTGERGGIGTFDDVDEDCGASNTVNVTRIVTEKDTAKGRKSTNQVGLPGDRCLDIVDIVRGSQLGTRHDGQGVWVVGLRIVGMYQARDEEPGTRNIGRANRAPLREGGMVEVRKCERRTLQDCGGISSLSLLTGDWGRSTSRLLLLDG